MAINSLQAGVDFTKLRDLLAEGKFQDADDETRALLIKLAGLGAVDRKWVYFSEVSSASAAACSCITDHRSFLAVCLLKGE